MCVCHTAVARSPGRVTRVCVCVCRLQQEVSVLQQQLRESRRVVGSLQVKLTNTHTGEF